MEETLLLTGFEPFGKWTLNPSWEIARALDGEEIGGLRVVARNLPVNWTGSWPALEAAINETEPRYVLMLGLAGRRPHLSVETRACNACDQTPDNEGANSTTPDIEPGGSQYRESTLPTRSMFAAIEALGLPVRLSEDAGEYLCNNTLYRALSWVSTSGPNEWPQVGFIHVPNVPEVNPEIEGISLDDQIRAVRAAIGAIAALRPASTPT